MLAAECYESVHGRVVAAFDVGTQELPALRKADSVDSGGAGEDGVSGEVMADFLDLFREVAQKGCGAVRGRVGVEANVVGVSAGVYSVGEVADGAETVSFVVVAQTMPNNEWQGCRALGRDDLTIWSGDKWLLG